jgi:hypothetical protein
MVIYQVNLEIEPSIIDEYMSWLVVHVKEMVQFPGFQNAVILNEQQSSPQSNCISLAVQYSIESMKDLDYYLHHYAPKMRESGIQKFSNKFKASRKIFIINQEITK